MKRKIVLALVSLLVVISASLALVLVKINDIVATYRPVIEQKLSEALGTKVELGEISASLFPSTHIGVKEVRVLSQDGSTAPLSLGDLSASVSLGALLAKKLDITDIELENPKVALIKDSNGMRLRGLAPKPGSNTAPPTPPTQSAPPSTTAAPQATPLDIHISNISISNGEIAVDDKTTGRSILISAITLTSSVALRGTTVTLPATNLSFKLGSAPPLQVSGKNISFDNTSGQLTIESIDTKTDAGSIRTHGSLVLAAQTGSLTLSSQGMDLKRLAILVRDVQPSLAAMNAQGSIATNLSLTLSNNAPLRLQGPIKLQGIGVDLPGQMRVRGLAGEIAVSGTTSDLLLNAPSLQVSLQEKPLGISTSVKVSPNALSVQSLTVKGLGGEVKAPANLNLTPQGGFSVQPVVTSLSITELLAITKPSLVSLMTGTISAAKGSFSGGTKGDIPKTISGSGDILVRNAALKGVNVPHLILSKVSNIPLLEGTLRSHIAPEHQKYFSDPDTKIQELRGDYSLGGGVITVRALKVISDAFTLDCNGTMGMDGELNLSSNFILAADISRSLAKRSKTIQSMLSKQGLLEIPVAIKGKSPQLAVFPDISKLLSGAGGRLLEEKAGDLLNKALGGKKGEPGKKPLGGIFKF